PRAAQPVAAGRDAGRAGRFAEDPARCVALSRHAGCRPGGLARVVPRTPRLAADPPGHGPGQWPVLVRGGWRVGFGGAWADHQDRWVVGSLVVRSGLKEGRESNMPRTIQGILAVLGRVMLCTIFFMSAVGNKIPHFDAVSELMGQKGIPAPKVMLVGAIVFLITGSLSVVLGFKARVGATLLLI